MSEQNKDNLICIEVEGVSHNAPSDVPQVFYGLAMLMRMIKNCDKSHQILGLIQTVSNEYLNKEGLKEEDYFKKGD